MTTRPTPTPAELLTAARALLAQAEAMMREPAEAAPTVSKPDDSAAWRGWVAPTTFTTWPDGCAVGVDHGNGPDAMAWTVIVTGADTMPQGKPASKPKPVGTWGGHTDWIPWSGGACPVNFGSVVQYIMRDHGTGQHLHIGQDPAESLRWNHHHEPAHPMAQNDIIAYRIATPAAPPEPEPEPEQAGVLLTGWRMFGRGGWELWDTAWLVRATVSDGGWACRGTGTGPETGLRGKELAVKHLLANGARWESDARWSASLDHIPETVREFRPGDVAVMTDGSQRTVEETTRTRILFADGTWLSFDVAETAMAARIPAADRT